MVSNVNSNLTFNGDASFMAIAMSKNVEYLRSKIVRIFDVFDSEKIYSYFSTKYVTIKIENFDRGR